MYRLKEFLETNPKEIDNLPIGYASIQVQLDKNGDPVGLDFLYVNPSFEEHSGLSIDRLKRDVRNYTKQEKTVFKKWLLICHEVTKSKLRFQNVEWSAFLKKWVEVSCFSSKDNDVILLLRDVTAEEEERRMYLDVLSQISDSVFIVDFAGRFKFVGPSVKSIFGFDESEVSSLGNISKILGPELLPKIKDPELEYSNLAVSVTDKSGRTHHLLVDVKFTELFNGSKLVSCRDITDRVQQERENQEKQLFLDTVINSMPDLVWMKDADGKYIMCNHEFEKFAGRAQDKILGKSDFDFASNEIARSHVEGDQKSIELGGPRISEETLTYADRSGKSVIAEILKTPIYSDLGQLLGVLGIARDITQRTREMRRFKAMIEQAPYGIIMVDINNRFIDANARYLEILGYNKAELSGSQFKDKIIENGGYLPNHLASSLLVGECVNAEFEQKVNTRSGQRLDLRVIASTLEDPYFEDGQVFILHIEDLTKKNSNEEELEVYRRFFELSEDFMCLISNNGKFIKVNSCFLELGYSLDELLGHHVHEFVLEEDRPRMIQRISDLLSGKEHVTFETRFQSKSGELREFYWSATRDPQNDTIYAVAKDVSELKDTSNKVKEYYSLYSRLVQSTPDAVFILNKKGRIVEGNKAAERMTGYSRTEMKELELLKLDVFQEENRIIELSSEIANGNSLVFETKFQHKEGQVTDVEMIVTPIILSETNWAIAIGRNITERKRSERDLSNAFKDLLKSQEITKMGSWHLDIRSNVLTWSDQIYRILGVEPQAFKGTMEAFFQFVHPEDRDFVRQTFERCLKSGESYEIVHRIIDSDGEIGYVEQHAEIKQGQSNDILEVHGTVQDISKEVMTMKELDHQVEKMNLALKGGRIIAWETDLKNQISMVFPTDLEESIKKRFRFKTLESMHHDIRDSQRSYCSAKIDEIKIGEIDHFDCEFQIKNEKDRWEWHTGSLSVIEKDELGRPTRVFGTLQDIEARKNIERVEIVSQESERLRVSRDIHDSIGQMLVGTRMMLNRTLDKNVKLKDLKQVNHNIDEMLAELIEESRFIINNYGISLSDKKNLKEAMLELGEKMHKIYAGEIHLQWIGSLEISDIKVATNIFRIYQEALTNSIKYSKATHINTIIRNISNFEMQVIDDGEGFDVEEVNNGFGLTNMRERASQLNATFMVDSTVTEGTVVTLKMF